MLFNSVNFAIFLPIVFFIYWFVAGKSLNLQNILLLASSYFFYACWDWRFLLLLIFSTFLDYVTGIKISTSKNMNNKKFWFWLSISINLGFLGIFKYYNFFAQSFSDAIANFGLKINPFTLQVILPVGISFYTFHGLSYVIDIYNNKIKAERNFIDYSVFVSFFPLLVAGPIERATHLLPQIQKQRVFSFPNAVVGLRQILWGLFKKVVIADQCAKIANILFDLSNGYSGTTLIIGAVAFAFQIYCDFSGYSDIALGTAKLFGIDLLRNFAFPYFSRDIAEFWRRWHISLSSWFKDYLYVPLGGSRVGLWKKVRNTLIIFLVSGFWHGANWTFIAWGALNALYILPSIIFKSNRLNIETIALARVFPTARELFAMLFTFTLTVFAWVFFRSQDIGSAIIFIKKATIGLFYNYSYLQTALFFDRNIGYSMAIIICLFILFEWNGRGYNFAIEKILSSRPVWIRWSFYYVLIYMVLIYSGGEEPFIYFQF